MATVVLVYGHDFLRQNLADLLVANSHQVVEAKHENEALQRMTSQTDVVVCEERAAARILEAVHQLRIPVIVTIREIPEVLTEAETAVEYLEIPFSSEEFLARVAQAVRRRTGSGLESS
jgi:DNA-binding NtrC family response regulator